ncbi:MAG: decarboxylase [Lachnospiraceae bacterium]|nr:decarboxylase [Lachnospiraceae bacterium]
MKKYLLDQLTEYTKSDAYPLHMPGHKRQMQFFERPYEMDITEIDGFDNLHHPEGILKEAQERAAGLYGADETHFLVNGSTGGILAAVSAAVPRGGRILMARNSHKSAFHAALINGLRVTWLYPDLDARRGIYGSIRPEQVREALRNDDSCSQASRAVRNCAEADFVQGSGGGARRERIAAVLITSPTYDGVVSDIRAIAEEVHQAGAILIVDEAHGAHFAMHSYFPDSALSLGADLVINSLHKTMPSLTQTALLHVKGSRIDRDRLRFFLGVYQSSSPSYVLMASIDECVRLMESRRQELFDDFVRRLEALRRSLGKMMVLHLVSGEEPELNAFAFDRSKILISTEDAVGEDADPLVDDTTDGTADGIANNHITGVGLAQILRTCYHLEVEMASEHSITAILTAADTQEGFDRLERALLEIDARLCERRRDSDANIWEFISDGQQLQDTAMEAMTAKKAGFSHPEPVMTMTEADGLPREPVPLEQSPGRVAAEAVYLYPPGIPLLVPGERVPDRLPDLLARYQAMGLQVQGLADYSVRTLLCLTV